MGQPTNFPGGISDAGIARVRFHKSITGKAIFATGLTTVSGGLATLEKIETGAGKTWLVQVKPHAEAGKVEVKVIDSAGNESSTAVNVTIDVDGVA